MRPERNSRERILVSVAVGVDAGPGIAFQEMRTGDCSLEMTISMLKQASTPQWIVLSAVLLFAPAALYAEAPTAEVLTWGQKMFAKQNVDFGVVARGADVSYRIPVENLYEETINIVDVKTGCSCITATASKPQLLSGEKGYLDVKLDTVRFSRERKSQVIVSLTMEAPQGGGQGAYQQVTIPVHGYIRTDVVLTPGGAEFGLIGEGETAEREIQLAYAGRNDWKVTNVRTKNPNITVKCDEISRGQDGTVNYNLKVSLKPGVPMGELRDRVIIETNDESNPEIPMLVEAKVESEFTITPAEIQIGNLSPGQSKTQNVVIKGRKPFSIKKLESDSGSSAFEMVLPKGTSIVQVVRLVVTAPTSSGSLKESFTVSVTGSDQPLTFTLSGKVLEPTTAQNR